jgi:hypothetical protein
MLNVAVFAALGGNFLGASGALSKAVKTASQELSHALSGSFNFQIEGFDSGVDNGVWILVVLAIIVVGILYVYRSKSAL